MASLRKKPNSKNWVACFLDATGKPLQRSTGVADCGTPKVRAAAKKKAMDVARAYEIAARGDRTEARIRQTVSELFSRNSEHRLEWLRTDEFLRKQLERVRDRKDPNTYTRYKSVIEDFILSLGGAAKKPIGDVSPEDVERFVDVSFKTKLAGTIRNELKILSRMFGIAVRQGLALVNPVAAVDAPDEAGESKEPFTWQQVILIASACAETRWEKSDPIHTRLADWLTAVTVAAYTGLRLGDVSNLEWRHVDLEAKYIRIEPEKGKRRHRRRIHVPIHDSLHRRLLEISDENRHEGFVMKTLGDSRIGGRSGLSRQFLRIMEKAGVENPKLRDGLGKGRAFHKYGFHSFRHTFNSLLANAGVSQEIRMALVGHESERTNEIYTHLAEETLRPAVARLPGLS